MIIVLSLMVFTLICMLITNKKMNNTTKLVIVLNVIVLFGNILVLKYQLDESNELYENEVYEHNETKKSLEKEQDK